MVILSIVIGLSSVMLTYQMGMVNLLQYLLVFGTLSTLLYFTRNRYAAFGWSIAYLLTIGVEYYLIHRNPVEMLNPQTYLAIAVIGDICYIYLFVFVLIAYFLGMIVKYSKDDDEQLTKTKEIMVKAQSRMGVNVFAAIFILACMTIYYTVKTDISMWVFAVCCCVTCLLMHIAVISEGRRLIREEIKRNENKAAAKEKADTVGQESTSTGVEVLPTEADGE